MNEPSRWSWWAIDIATDIVLRWHSQGGIDQSYLKPHMEDDLNHLLDTLGKDIEEIHTKGFTVISARREAQRNEVIYDLVSQGRYDITGRGVIYSVPNPRDTKAGDWSWLVNHKVKIDGRVCLVTAVESFAIGGTYPKGKPIGLLVKEINE